MIPLTNDEKILAVRKIDGLDVDAGLKTIANMVAPYLRVLGTFVRNVERDKDLLDNQLAAGNTEDFRTSVHGYKSALGNIGAIQLSEEAYKLEKAVIDNDRSFIDDNLPAFKEGIFKLAKSLEEILS